MKYNRPKSSVYHKIIFTISLFILFFISVLTAKHINNISNSTKLLMHTYEVSLELEHLYSYIKDSDNNMRTYIITRDNFYLVLYQNDIKKVNNSFSILKELHKNNISQQKNLESLYKIINNRYEYISKNVNPNKNADLSKSYDFKRVLNESNRLLADIRIKLNDMVHTEKTNLIVQNSIYDKQIYFTPIITLSILLLAFLSLLFTYNQNTKDIQKLQTANLKLNKSNFLSSQAEIISKFGTWEWDLNNTNKRIYSDNIYRILGVEPESFESVRENFLKFVHPQDLEKVNTVFENFIKNIDNVTEAVELLNVRFRIIRADGKTRILRSIGKLFIDDLGNKSVLGVTHDITDEDTKNELLKSNYEDLVKVNEQLKIFEESSKQAEILGKYGSWVLNYNTSKLTYSDNRYRLLGIEPRSFEPTIENLFGFAHPDDKEMVDKAFKKALTSMEFPPLNYRIIRKDGKIRHFRTIAKSYIDSSGTQSMIGTTRDVTEEYNKNLQLKQHNIELKKNIKELDEFNQVASHDLQEPLRKIQTFISRINDKEKENMTDIGKEYLSKIETASERMRVLIDDLLQYSKANRTEEKLESTNLNKVLNDSLTELSQNIEDKKAVINHTELPIINGIPFQMQQLLSNLLSNSLKYSKVDTPPIIDIDCSEITAKNEPILKNNSSKKYYKINVTDNGIGFEQKYSKKIFLLFNRLHSKTEYQGTGVGLAICEKIAEKHDGFIFAKSNLNEGATFTIYLPVPSA